MINHVILACFLSLGCLGFATDVVFAGSLKQSLDKIHKLAQIGDLPRALKELQWVQTELEQSHGTFLKRFLPKSLTEFKAVPYKGGIRNLDIKSMYVSQSGVSASQMYKHADNGKVLVSIANALGQGSVTKAWCNDPSVLRSQGIEVFRIGDSTATLQEIDLFGKSFLVTVCISGGAVRFETKDAQLESELRKMAEAFQYTELEKYMAGFQ